MDNTPFISRNNDLFIMLFAGMTTMYVNQYVIDLSIQAQFLMVMSIGALAGLFIGALYHSVEWAMFFVIGAAIVAVAPLAIQGFVAQKLYLNQMIEILLQTGRYCLFLLSSWIIAIPSGYLVQKILMNKYYRRSHF